MILSTGNEEISKWTSPRKSSRTSTIIPKTEELSEDSNSRQSFGEGNNGGGRGARRSLGVGERERRNSIQQETRPKRKSTGGIGNRGDGNASRTIVGGRSIGGGGGAGRDCSGEDTGGSRTRLGGTDLRNGGRGGSGGGRLDGEVENSLDNIKDHTSPTTRTKPTSQPIKEEKNLISVQESIKDYQKHLEQVKKANQERLAAMKAEEERKQAKKAEKEAKKRAKKLEIQEKKRLKRLEAESRKQALKMESESNDTTVDNSVSGEIESPAKEPEQQDVKKESEGVEMECEVKDEFLDEPMEDGEDTRDNLEDSNYVSDEFSKESSDTEVTINENSLYTKENDDVNDSNKDSKSSSDQENAKLDNLKKKRRGKFRLTTKTNKSKKFAVVQSDSYIKTINKAITDNSETSKPNEESNGTNEEEQSLVLRKTERERPLSKRLLQQKLLKTKLKEIGKKLLSECGKNEIQQTLDLRRLTRTNSQDQIINKSAESSTEELGSKENKENRSENDTNETIKPSETPDDPDEFLEECLYKDECSRKFCSYFSMMRHVAFFHRPERTAELMKLKLKNK